MPVSKLQESTFKVSDIAEERAAKEYAIIIKELMGLENHTQPGTRTGQGDIHGLDDDKIVPKPTGTPVTADPLRGIRKAMNVKVNRASVLREKIIALQGELASLEEKPRERIPLGKNVASTCANCHAKGHRNSQCIFILNFHFKFFNHGGPINQEWLLFRGP